MQEKNAFPQNIFFSRTPLFPSPGASARLPLSDFRGSPPPSPSVPHGCGTLRLLFFPSFFAPGASSMKFAGHFFALTAVLALPPGANPQSPSPAPRSITVDDLFQLREVDDPQLTPDGQRVAYTVKTSMLKEDK